jgi:hypothetical protein
MVWTPGEDGGREETKTNNRGKDREEREELVDQEKCGWMT